MRTATTLVAASALALACTVGSAQASLVFSTFVQGSDILAAEGQQNTIGFNYAGNKFVGSVYLGPNNLQLYSTDLTGGSVTTFGAPIPNGFAGEVVVAASLGQAGFPTAHIYAGAGNDIYQFNNDGSGQSLFATGFGGTVRQILFDPGSSFGGKMLVTTQTGAIYTVDSSGTKTLLANVGEDTEGMDIVTAAWGPYAGYLMVASEGSGTLRLISPSGVVTVVPIAPLPALETVSFVPLNLNGLDPLEGFYVANYAQDIQKAAANQFLSNLGDAILTGEFSSNSPVWALHYDSFFDVFTVLDLGTLPNQSEDGIFVTAQRITETGVPEPTTFALIAGALFSLFGLGLMRRRADA